MAAFSLNVEDSSPLFSYAPEGAWSDSPSTDALVSSYSGSSLHTTSVQGATATINFNGTGISIFGGNRPDYGTYTIAVDGQVIKSGSSQSNDTGIKRTLGFIEGLPSGPHTVIITHTSGGPIDIDFVMIQCNVGPSGSQLVSTMYDDNDQRISYLPSAGAWQTESDAAYMGGTLHSASAANAAASLAFSGDALALYGTVSPNHADIQISIDGQIQQTVPGGSKGLVDGIRAQTLLYFSDSLGPGQHTVTVTPAPGTADGALLDIDAFQVFSTSADGSSPGVDGLDSTLGIVANTPDHTAASATVIPTPQVATQQSVGFPVGAIAGIAVGGVIALLGLLALVVVLFRRRKREIKRMVAELEEPKSPDLPIQRPRLLESGELASPMVETVPQPLYRVPTRSFPPPNSVRGSMYSTSSSGQHSRAGSVASSTTPMLAREVPIIKVPRPPPAVRARTTEPVAIGAGIRIGPGRSGPPNYAMPFDHQARTLGITVSDDVR